MDPASPKPEVALRICQSFPQHRLQCWPKLPRRRTPSVAAQRQPRSVGRGPPVYETPETLKPPLRRAYWGLLGSLGVEGSLFQGAPIKPMKAEQWDPKASTRKRVLGGENWVTMKELNLSYHSMDV